MLIQSMNQRHTGKQLVQQSTWWPRIVKLCLQFLVFHLNLEPIDVVMDVVLLGPGKAFLAECVGVRHMAEPTIKAFHQIEGRVILVLIKGDFNRSISSKGSIKNGTVLFIALPLRNNDQLAAHVKDFVKNIFVAVKVVEDSKTNRKTRHFGFQFGLLDGK